MSDDAKAIVKEFKESVNMTPRQLESWLDTEESRSVGQKERDGEESKGHASGRRIIQLLEMKQSEYDEDDLSHMKKVIAYIHRHSAQQPSGDVKETPWRYSLMNWGHDPIK